MICSLMFSCIVYLMVVFSVFDPSKIIVFHVTKKSGYLSVFDVSKKREKSPT